MAKYIYQYKNYPNFTWNRDKILNALTLVANKQGRIIGKMQQFGFGDQQMAVLDALTEEITKSSEIEGEILDSGLVRSSLAKRLNIQLNLPLKESHHIDGLVQATMDAVNNYDKKLTKTRLFGWHAALFPTGFSGMDKIRVGKYRNQEMQIVSPALYNARVYYEAPMPNDVPTQMDDFLKWLNTDNNENPIIKAAIAHLWFVIIHPFDDGNGRITRIITEMLLARAERSNLRFYSMSAQIQHDKKEYYKILEQTTTGNLDITNWILWFLNCLGRALDTSHQTILSVIKKSEFWKHYNMIITDSNQREIINRIFDGFIGNMTSGKAAKFLHVSQDTATRLLQDLVAKGAMEKCGDGRNTHYVLKEFK